MEKRDGAHVQQDVQTKPHRIIAKPKNSHTEQDKIEDNSP